jgi:plasmid segregation protein ParM
MIEYKVVAGIDVGNGYTKARVAVAGSAPRDIDMPSCVAHAPAGSWIPFESSTAPASYMSDLANELDFDVRAADGTVETGSLDGRRLLCGRRATASGRVPVTFDINDSRPKCDDPLSATLVCAVIAAAAVGHCVETTGTLPVDGLGVTASVALALPIADYARCRERYQSSLEDMPRVVTIRNFEIPIEVVMSFRSVTVVPEGAAAQVAIVMMGPGFVDDALEKARALGFSFAGETGRSIISYGNTIGVDIGEGTVNFPVFRNGRVSVESSSSIDRGYGTVLADVCERARGTGYAPRSRRELSEFMLRGDPSPRDVRIRARLRQFIDDEADAFARDVMSEYTRVLRRSGLISDVVYVYGGGADAMADRLWPELIRASMIDEDIFTPVIYVPAGVSRTLNRDGLFAVARRSAEASDGE